MLEHTAVQSAMELGTFAHEVVEGNLCDTLAIYAPHELQQLEEHPCALSLLWTAALHILTCKQQSSHDCLHKGCGKTGSTSAQAARQLCSGHLVLGRPCMGMQECHTTVLTGKKSLLNRALGDHRDAQIFAVL